MELFILGGIMGIVGGLAMGLLACMLMGLIDPNAEELTVKLRIQNDELAYLRQEVKNLRETLRA